MKNNYPKCGEIYWVEVGSETKKRRPCIILSNNAYNKYSPRFIVAPITSQIKSIYPCEIAVDVSGRPGKVMFDQIRSFDKQRLMGKLWEVEPSVLEQFVNAFKNLVEVY